MTYRGSVTVTDEAATEAANRILATLRAADPELFADPRYPAQLAASFACLAGVMLAHCGQGTVNQMASFYQLMDLAWSKMTAGANGSGSASGDAP